MSDYRLSDLEREIFDSLILDAPANLSPDYFTDAPRASFIVIHGGMEWRFQSTSPFRAAARYSAAELTYSRSTRFVGLTPIEGPGNVRGAIFDSRCGPFRVDKRPAIVPLREAPPPKNSTGPRSR